MPKFGIKPGSRGSVYNMKALAKTVILIMLMMISIELVAPLLAESRVSDHKLPSSVSVMKASDIDLHEGHVETNGCMDSCGIPAHLHISQFPPVAFHSCITTAQFVEYPHEYTRAPAASHDHDLIRPPIQA